MYNLIDILSHSKSYLKKQKISDYARSAEEIFCMVLKCTRSDLFLYPQKKINITQKIQIEKLLDKRAIEKIPLAYLLGDVSFFGCKIKVTKDVLIPRMETEELVEKMIKILEKEDLKNNVLWDIATGSGCVGIALKKYFPTLKVVISDISEKGLKVAEENAQANHIDVEIRKGDLFEPFEGEKADFIVSNPPYIAKGEIEHLQREVKDHEPILALDGGESGVEFYKRFFQDLEKHLHPNGKVFFEIGESQKETLKEIFSKKIFFKMSFFKDLAKRDRFFLLEFE